MTPVVIDSVLPDPLAYRAACLAMPRNDVNMLGVIWRGYSQAPDRSVADWIDSHFPTVHVVTSLTRLSPLRQETPNYRHTDTDMGDVTAILYLNPDPPATDGTTFWKNKKTGSDVSLATDAMDRIEEGFLWRDDDHWEPTRTIPAVFNRMVLFPSSAFHSRAMFDNYGTDDASARLIHICWGTGVLS